MSTMNENLRWLAINAPDWNDNLDRIARGSVGVDWFSSEHFPGRIGFSREELRVAKAELSGERMDNIARNGNDGEHYYSDITAYDPPGPTSMPECTFTTPDEDEAWAEAEKRMDAIGQNGGTGEHYEAKSLEERYPQYYKSVRHLEFVDVYQVHNLFAIEDWSGCIQHASKKLLLSGVRTGGKTKRQDVEEARDTLTRWLKVEQGR